MPEPDPMLRLCSLTESETQLKYDSGRTGRMAAADSQKFKMAELELAGAGSSHEGPGENIYDEPTSSAPLLGNGPLYLLKKCHMS
jgi:hypothetical protein